MHVLVIGGTGPTGIPLVQGLVDRGHRVTILHRGTHERAETPTSVEHLHADPYDEASLRDALAGRTFDVTYAMYGRLRLIAEVLHGHTGRVISVGGVPAYRGWMNAWVYDPPGLPVPVREDAPTVDVPEERREGVPHRPHRGGGVRRAPRRDPLPLSVRVRALPADAPRVDRRAARARRP